MATLNILFGFQQEETRGKIVQEILRCGYQVEYDIRTTKEGIRAYLNEHKECEYCVLREGMEAEQFSAVEMAALTDTRDINIVAIIDRNHYGTDFMNTLYAAGITGAVMVTEKKGADPRLIAHLLMEKRSRKKARRYYGMGERNVSVNVLTYQEFVQQYSILMNESEGINLIDRYLMVVRHLSPRQVADFTKRLPAEVRKELTRYEEFYLVVSNLNRNGITLKFTRPEKLIRGLTDEQFTQALRKDGRVLKRRKLKLQQPVLAPLPSPQPEPAAAVTVPKEGTPASDSSTSAAMQADASPHTEKVMASSSEVTGGEGKDVSSPQETAFGIDNFFFLPSVETTPEDTNPQPEGEENVVVSETSQNDLQQKPRKKIPEKLKTKAQLKEEMKAFKKRQKQDKALIKAEAKKEKKERAKKPIHWKVVLFTLLIGLVLLGGWYLFMANFGYRIFF